jgi:hypothetical protein
MVTHNGRYSQKVRDVSKRFKEHVHMIANTGKGNGISDADQRFFFTRPDVPDGRFGRLKNGIRYNREFRAAYSEKFPEDVRVKGIPRTDNIDKSTLDAIDAYYSPANKRKQTTNKVKKPVATKRKTVVKRKPVARGRK